MAGTVTKKKPRSRSASQDLGTSSPRKTARVADMTADQLEAMITATVENVLSEWLGDPDAGLELRPEIVQRIQEQRAEYTPGKRGRPLAQYSTALNHQVHRLGETRYEPKH